MEMEWKYDNRKCDLQYLGFDISEFWMNLGVWYNVWAEDSVV